MRSQARRSLRCSPDSAVSAGSASTAAGFSLGSGRRSAAAASSVSTTPRSYSSATSGASTKRCPPCRASTTRPSKMSSSASASTWRTRPMSTPSLVSTGTPSASARYEVGGPRSSTASDSLEQRRRAQPAAAAHRHQAGLAVLVLHLVQERGEQAGAGRAQRVAEGHGAAARVDAVHVRLVLAGPGGDHRGERLVYLDDVDVVDAHPVAVEDLLGGGDRAGEHGHRVDA